MKLFSVDQSTVDMVPRFGTLHVVRVLACYTRRLRDHSSDVISHATTVYTDTHLRLLSTKRGDSLKVGM